MPDANGDSRFLEALLPHVERIGRLSLAGYSSIEAVADDFPKFFASSMPNLTSLELQQAAEPVGLFPPDNSSTPPPFLNVSKLESLSLTRPPLYPPLFVTTSLVELKLIGCATSFLFGTFLGLLVSNPNLELVALDIRFVRDSVETAPAKMVPLSLLRHLSITCSNAIDSKGSLSCISIPPGVRLEVTFTRPDQPAELGAFLPSPTTVVQDFLGPINTIKTQFSPWEIRLFGIGSSFTFRSPDGPRPNVHPELQLFPGTVVREFYTNICPLNYNMVGLSWTMRQLPALETLAFSKTEFHSELLSALTKEPVLCPALRTIAFLDCGINSDLVKGLGEAITKRGNLMATRLYRVVIVDSTGTKLPDLASIKQLKKSVPCVEVKVDDELSDLVW